MTVPALATRDRAGRIPNEGARLLSVVARVNKHIVIAAHIGKSERYVGQLISGACQPSAETIAKLWLAYGIAGEAWGLAPADETEVPLQRNESTTDDVKSRVRISNEPRQSAAE